MVHVAPKLFKQKNDFCDVDIETDYDRDEVRLSLSVLSQSLSVRVFVIVRCCPTSNIVLWVICLKCGHVSSTREPCFVTAVVVYREFARVFAIVIPNLFMILMSWLRGRVAM